MALFKISIFLLGTLTSLASADFQYDNIKTFSLDDAMDSMKNPWIGDDFDRSDSFQSASSQLNPQFATGYPFDNLKHGTDPVPSIKKIPIEDKAFKKVIEPFFALSDSSDPKFKEIVFESGAPYCQEVSAKDTKTDASGTDQKQMTCYRCKDPKSDATYEHCSYNSKAPKTNSREPRSNAAAEKTFDSLTAASHSRSTKRSSGQGDDLPRPFQFTPDYFHAEASQELPAEYEKDIDNCERVIRDSMVCMVCKDPKTNGKYEQCSYVAQPDKKAFAYTKSKSFGSGNKDKSPSKHSSHKKSNKPHRRHEDEQEEETRQPPRTHHHHRQHHHHHRSQPRQREEPEELTESPEAAEEYTREADEEVEEDKEGHGTHYTPEQTYQYPTYNDYEPSSSYGNYGAEESEEEEASPKRSVQSKGGCTTVQRDGQSCKVCTDPKTNGKSENCEYAYAPKDKAYRYTKSKTFGYPESQRSSGGGGRSSHRRNASPEESDDGGGSSEKQERDGSGEDYDGYVSEPSSPEYIRSESEKISQKVKGEGDCRKVKKDSMICTVCFDPSTGGDFEQCNYAYEPKDKVFAYSKSKSFGSPTKSSSSSPEYDYAGSAEENPEETYALPVIYPTGTSPLDYIPKTSESQLSSVYTTKNPKDKEPVSKVDSGFYDATVRRAEIEKIVKDIGAEDRSKCKKELRNGMTCYKCKDDKGFVNEECVFVNDSEGKSSSSVVQSTESSTSTELPAVTTKPEVKITTTESNWKPILPRKTRDTKESKEEEKPVDKDEDLEPLSEELDEAEPYDYVAETKPVYSKVLGITLPAYMIQRSQHEIEFDELVESSKF